MVLDGFTKWSFKLLLNNYQVAPSHTREVMACLGTTDTQSYPGGNDLSSVLQAYPCLKGFKSHEDGGSEEMKSKKVRCSWFN